MFLDHKNQYYENDHTTRGNLQIQCDPYQIPNGSFTVLEEKNLQYVWKHNRPPNSQSNLEKEKWS